MQKLIIKNKYQSQNRMNILTAAGISQINEPITPKNGERIWGGLGVVTFNQVSQYSEEENPNDPITPPDCPNCGGGIEPEPSVPPSANCEKKNISELKQILDDYANQSFCDKEFPDVQFSTFIGKDSSGNDIELRLLCPVDDCSDGTFWSPGAYPDPAYEAIYDVIGYSENCINSLGLPYLKVRKISPCEIFERHKAYIKEQISSFKAPCECEEFRWEAMVRYHGEYAYYEFGDGLIPPDVIDEACAVSMSKSLYPTYKNDATFIIYCKNNSSCLPNGKSFSFQPNYAIRRYYEDTCMDVRCQGGAEYCAGDCYGAYERIFENCCFHNQG